MQAHGHTLISYRARMGLAGIAAALLIIVLSVHAVAADNRDGATLSAVAPEMVIHEPTAVTDGETLLPALAEVESMSREQILFLEQNTILPAVAEHEVLSRSQMEFVEQNTILPAVAEPEVLSRSQIEFLEQNTILPAVSAPDALSYEQILFLEQNWAD